ncbi:MAG TPA: endolytic transglycosylase MltG [Candidatus Paceibacterota bacterium]
MKIKFLLALLAFSVGGVLYLVFYYSLDPALLTKLSFYANLANPSVRIVKIQEGLRKEEVADVMAGALGWSDSEVKDFINIHLALNSANMEGRYFPKTYMINKDESPSEVTATMFGEFSKQTGKIKKPESKKVINEDTVLKIASIIQRESNGKTDMKLISGIIWNRIFSGMKLQIDATLQYAKGNEEDGWWEEVKSADKKIKSSYNTYMHAGLPPAPIANPGLSAIEAAYNPQKTNCIFYLHDKNRQIHCTKTYEEHKKNISIYY